MAPRRSAQLRRGWCWCLSVEGEHEGQAVIGHVPSLKAGRGLPLSCGRIRALNAAVAAARTCRERPVASPLAANAGVAGFLLGAAVHRGQALANRKRMGDMRRWCPGRMAAMDVMTTGGQSKWMRLDRIAGTSRLWMRRWCGRLAALDRRIAKDGMVRQLCSLFAEFDACRSRSSQIMDQAAGDKGGGGLRFRAQLPDVDVARIDHLWRLDYGMFRTIRVREQTSV